MEKNKIPTIGCMIWEGDYSVKNDTDFRYGKRLKYFEYNWRNPQKEKIVVFSDYTIPQMVLPRFDNVVYKVAWMMEGPGVYSSYGGHTAVKKWILENLDKITVVATCDDSLIEKYPDKMIFVPFGGVIVLPHETKIYSKTKLCSMTSGWLFGARNEIYNQYKDTDKIDFLGRAFGNPYDSTVEGFADYMYHISISSCCDNRYFSSNITDAFACGTIPIWWGCPRIGEFFNIDGIIVVNSVKEIQDAINNMSVEDYESRKDAIAENFQLVEKYRTPDNNLWENVLAALWEKI